MDFSVIRPSVIVFIAIGIVLLCFSVLIPALGVFDVPEPSIQGDTQEGTVTQILKESREPSPAGEFTYRKLEIETEGRTVIIDLRYSSETPEELEVGPGDEVILGVGPGQDGDQYFIIDFVRRPSLLLWGLAFVGLVVLVGRWRGLASLIGLAASLLIIVRFILPGILSGADPVFITVLGSLAIVSTTIYLAHGVHAKTTVALLGTTLSFLMTAALASLAIAMTRLSGLADEEATSLFLIPGLEIDFRGLLLSSMIIGALGVLDDVTTTQASAAFELHKANPSLGARELYQRTMNIGRDHITATVNTLFLAYAGASLPVLVILAMETEPLNMILNREFLATEIVRTLVGSIGLIAAVPVTTVLAALAATWSRSPAQVRESHPETRGG